MAALNFKESWAENETRTRDPDLGKVVLYQLSYFRLFVNSATLFCDYGANIASSKSINQTFL